MKIIDNLLSPYDFNELKRNILQNYFPWQLSLGVVDGENPVFDPKYNYQFYHTFYDQPITISREFDYLHPIFNAVKPQVLIRAKLNLTPNTPENIEYGFHTDLPEPLSKNAMTAVYYLNTNNGYTIVGDQKVDTIENRLVVFPADTPHTGATCTDESYRIVLNLNYIES